VKRLLKEPLLHFVILGGLLFALFSFVDSGETIERDDQIVVSAAKIEHLAAIFARTWQRPPTAAELKGLVDEYVREEAAYREGLALGLDRDDLVIRRRLRQKLEFIAEDVASQAEPTEADLAAHLAASPDDYRVDPRFTFRHVYLSPDNRDDIGSEADRILRILDVDPSRDHVALGDRTLLEPAYADASLADVSSILGPRFASALEELEPGGWTGSIPSAYGAHLVILDEREAGRIPELARVRASVQRDWMNARRRQALDDFYDALIRRYNITVEWPKPAEPQAEPASP